jgi:hypothetical protein
MWCAGVGMGGGEGEGWKCERDGVGSGRRNRLYNFHQRHLLLCACVLSCLLHPPFLPPPLSPPSPLFLQELIQGGKLLRTSLLGTVVSWRLGIFLAFFSYVSV